eukprot:COSAG05_NODE_3304_length_2163_cov_1.624213_3_plen_171_part_01
MSLSFAAGSPDRLKNTAPSFSPTLPSLSRSACAKKGAVRVSSAAVGPATRPAMTTAANIPKPRSHGHCAALPPRQGFIIWHQLLAHANTLAGPLAPFFNTGVHLLIMSIIEGRRGFWVDGLLSEFLFFKKNRHTSSHAWTGWDSFIRPPNRPPILNIMCHDDYAPLGAMVL